MDINSFVNKWIGVTEDGLWTKLTDDTIVTFDRKKDLIEDIASARLDAAKKPKIKRWGVGRYLYTPKDCDTLRYDPSGYVLVKLTSENMKDYKELIEEWCCEFEEWKQSQDEV